MCRLQEYFPRDAFPNLIVGLDEWDDAAVYRVNDETAIVLTVDFFTPVVDDPTDFGAIAAANALSDIYAMGADLILALNICGFPKDFPKETIQKILEGGAGKVREAGGVLAGGHTIDDNEPKYGLVAMGIAHPDKVLTNSGAKPNDVLVLTKPLGVGIVTTVLKAGEADIKDVDIATGWMKRLSRVASGIIVDVGANAMTDVTGFALPGHSLEMARNSDVRLNFRVEKIPFISGAERYADMWLFPEGTSNNERSFKDNVLFDDQILEETRQLIYTPETSGGLLAAIPPENLDTLKSRFQKAGEKLWVIGNVSEGEGLRFTP